MLDLQSWLPQAMELVPNIGQRRTCDHDCGAGKKLIVENKEQGYSAWCYRCSDKGFHPHPQPSLAERIARRHALQTTEDAAKADMRPPVPTEFNPSLWPLPARVWLYKAGFSNDAIQAHGFYYSEPLARVVLPVFAGGILVYWQARGFLADRAKYINPAIDKPLAYYGDNGPLVLCEDILSAARVGEVAKGVGVLGTALTERAVAEVLRRADGGPILLWLDPDSAGRKGSIRIANQLRLCGADVRTIRSDLDPKFYSRAQIQELIQLA